MTRKDPIGLVVFRLAVLIFPSIFLAVQLWSQSVASSSEQASTSLKDSVQNAKHGTELHIFYVHGMGITPPNDQQGTQNFEVSQDFRRAFCKRFKCTSNTFEGREYANVHYFKPDSDPPDLKYLGKCIWCTKADWNAAAPFVDHYKLVLEKDETVIDIDEINWWPLVLAPKCRQIVANDAALVGPDKEHVDVCRAINVKDLDPECSPRCKAYAWINGAPNRPQSWPAPAHFNSVLKHNLLDWGFSDALLAVGPMHKYFVEGVRELVSMSVRPEDHQEYVVVSHSLGSYLIFSALDLDGNCKTTACPPWVQRLDKILGKTSHAYFMANQVRLLEFANLDAGEGNEAGNLSVHLEDWYDQRINAEASNKEPIKPPTIVAWSDPDDQLTWRLPHPDSTASKITIYNCPARNATRVLWLFANPESAHTNYDKNKKVIHAMLPDSDAPPCRNGEALNGNTQPANVANPDGSRTVGLLAQP